MDEKARYDSPEFEVIDFGLEDVIRTSGGGDDPHEGPLVGGSSMFNLF